MNSRKHIVRSFLERASAGDVRGAFAAFVGSDFKHHDAYCPNEDGLF